MPYVDREKQRAYQRDWLARRRARYRDGQTCANCGTTENLELHHRDKGTKVDHKIWSWAIPRLEAELAKCEWLCGPCHWELHSAERRAICGTQARYNRPGCRCGRCRAAHAEYAKAWRAAARSAA